MNLREIWPGILFIGGLVALGAWIADRPAALQPGGFLNPAEISEQNMPNAPVSVRTMSWSADGGQLLTISHGHLADSGRLTLYSLHEGARRIEVGASRD